MIIKKLVEFIIVKTYDLIKYIVNKEYKKFMVSGIIIIGGYFGSGKTLTAVNKIYQICSRYKNDKITVLTNINLYDFPKNVEVVKFVNQEQLLNRGENTIVLLDEVGALFNSRDWKSKQISPLFFNRLIQNRKKNTLFIFIAQDISDIDIMIRKKAREIHKTHMFLHRWVWVSVYDGKEYEKFDGDYNNDIETITRYNYIARERHFKHYDTGELVEQMEKEKFIPTSEIIQQTSSIHNINNINVDTDASKKRRIFKRRKRK